MSEFKVASRYAKSLLDLSREQGQLERVKSDMEYFAKICEINKDFIMLLKSPIVPTDKKHKVIEKIFKQYVSPLTFSIFEITIRKKREDILYAVSKEFISQYNSMCNIKIAFAITPCELSEDLKNKITSIAQKLTQSKIILSIKINPKIIGGLILRVDDLQLDLSVLSHLNRMRTSFTSDSYISKL